MIAAVRSTGAQNILLVGPLSYSNDFGANGEYLQYLPNDPLGNLVASWHSYSFNACNNQSCWNALVRPVIEAMPMIVEEIGESDCASDYIDQLMPWLDQLNTGYLAWTWNTWDCDSGPSLIANYSGIPTNFGAGYRKHLRQLRMRSDESAWFE